MYTTTPQIIVSRPSIRKIHLHLCIMPEGGMLPRPAAKRPPKEPATDAIAALIPHRPTSSWRR